MGDAPNREEVSDIDMVNEAVIEPALRNVSERHNRSYKGLWGLKTEKIYQHTYWTVYV